METITGSVGKGGQNLLDDVMVVQKLLNQHVATLGLPTLVVDGDAGDNTVKTIRAYQKIVLGIAAPDGRIDIGGGTWKALIAEQAPTPPAPPANASLSGAAWWHANQAKYPNSNKIIDLVPPFRRNVERFTDVLAAAGARISVASTLRHKTRAHLMHYCWKIANGLIAPANVPQLQGLDITWDHGNLAKSKKAAKEMKDLFGMAHIAALNSNHIEGRAIDMTIGWTGTINVIDAAGLTHALGAPRTGETNTVLHKIGASYGVKKLVSDKPHWSDKGD